LFFVKQRRILPSPRERNAIALMIQNEVGHTDEHVFLDIRVKLAVYFSQNIGRGGIPQRLGAQHTSANRHD
jgi:hypothetical protein